MSTIAEPTIGYETLLRRRADEQSAVTIHGVIAKKPGPGIFGPKGCTPILWCFCVQDTPSNPCPCMGPIIWLPEGQTIHIRESRRTGQQDDTLVEVDLPSDARVFLDETREIKPRQSANLKLLRYGPGGEFSRVEDAMWIQEYSPVRAATLVRVLEVVGSDPKLQAIAKKSRGRWKQIVAAFEVGWAVGEFIDDKTGLSDALSDWLFENLGPWDELF